MQWHSVGENLKKRGLHLRVNRCHARQAAQELVRLRVRRLALMRSTCALELGGRRRPGRPAQPRSWRVTW